MLLTCAHWYVVAPHAVGTCQCAAANQAMIHVTPKCHAGPIGVDLSWWRVEP